MEYNKAVATAFAAWGLLHVAVGLIAIGVYVTGGAEAMLPFVDLDPAVNDQSVRMSHLVVQFYEALLLIGFTVTVVGLTLYRRGEPVGLALNAVLVIGIDVFFLWYEVVPGHRPVAVGVLSVALFVVGVGAGWIGLKACDVRDRAEQTGEPAG